MIAAQVSGGVAPYTYTWSGGTPNVTGDTISNLSSSVYSLTVTDANGCSVVESDSVTEPAPVDLTVTLDSAVSCAGASDGVATVSVNGGTAPFDYQWQGFTPVTGSPDRTNTISGLQAGLTKITVTDANGCMAVDSVMVTQPEPLVLTLTVDQHVTCNGASDGRATATVSGGTAPYVYS
ncbi:MAG: adhesin, partial [Chloroflexi bacterium]